MAVDYLQLLRNQNARKVSTETCTVYKITGYVPLES